MVEFPSACCLHHAGEMFRGVFEALKKQLQQPPDQLTDFFPNGQRRILPSFFELLLHLQASGRSFTIVFRTFGTDLRDVIEEMNLFATGRHPSWPGVQLDGSDGTTDLRLEMPLQTGAFIRYAGASPCLAARVYCCASTEASTTRRSRAVHCA